jgi:AcrR family transcriptional regulator
VTLEQIENLGRPLRADAERNRRRILVAAAEVFAKRGLEAGLDEIARHAGVGTGTVYRRFPDKSMLIEALFESRIDAVLEMADAALSTPDPWTGLVQFIETSVEMQLADRGLKELLHGEGGPEHTSASGARFAARVETLIPTFSAIVERAKDAGQLRPDVNVTDIAVIQIMLTGVGTLAAEVQPQLWRRQLAILLDGLRVQPNTAAALPPESLTVEQFQNMCMSHAGHPIHTHHRSG